MPTGEETMKNVAVIEDEASAMELLVSFLERFAKERGEEFNIFRFSRAISFLTNYKANYDIVFLDIELPDLNGMEAARKLRDLDRNVALIFVTNMAQFAVRGYEVDAYDFIVKPVFYANFALKLQRVLDHIRDMQGVRLSVSVDDGTVALSSSEIRYIEIMKHRIVYHTVRGEFYSHGTLKKIEEKLKDNYFVRCNNCYLVNLRYVSAVKDFTVYVGEEGLQISHPKKKAFLHALNEYFGGGVV